MIGAGLPLLQRLKLLKAKEERLAKECHAKVLNLKFLHTLKYFQTAIPFLIKWPSALTISDLCQIAPSLRLVKKNTNWLNSREKKIRGVAAAQSLRKSWIMKNG